VVSQKSIVSISLDPVRRVAVELIIIAILDAVFESYAPEAPILLVHAR